eukprot:5170963-Prymnesium_polylepis.2
MSEGIGLTVLGGETTAGTDYAALRCCCAACDGLFACHTAWQARTDKLVHVTASATRFLVACGRWPMMSPGA